MFDYQLRQREYLLRISRAMTSRLDLPDLLRLILEHSAELLSGQVGLIALRQDDGSFRVVASYGLDPALLPFFAPLLSDIPAFGPNQANWQVSSLQVKLHLVSAAAGVGLRQVVALPLVMGDELIGAIYVFRSRGGAFLANDRQVLASFADQAAIAVHNARLYQEVIEEKKRLDAIIENSGDGVMILDRERRIHTFNRALSRMTGLPAEGAIGRHCYDVLDLVNEQGVSVCHNRCPLLHPAEDGSLYAEGRLGKVVGRQVTVGDTYSPLYDEGGNLSAVIGSVRDISRLREAEEMKSTFVSVISHELKTPVSIIKGYAGTLAREDARWDEQTLHQGLSVIEEEADRLNKLIDNLLTASRMQAGGLKLNFGYVSLPPLAEKVVEKLRPQADKHTFSLDFPPDFPAVPGDSERLQEVLANLVGNAIKYSPQGGLIRVSGLAEAGQVVVTVSDEGVGVPPEEQERIFERFYRAEGDLSSSTPGVGLGLYLCKAVVEAHGGRIWVESEPGRGASFIFTLPRGEDDGF
jgi:PAS domain S-box-containing protein